LSVLLMMQSLIVSLVSRNVMHVRVRSRESG
jgi:hypothetical protein